MTLLAVLVAVLLAFLAFRFVAGMMKFAVLAVIFVRRPSYRTILRGAIVPTLLVMLTASVVLKRPRTPPPWTSGATDRVVMSFGRCSVGASLAAWKSARCCLLEIRRSMRGAPPGG